MKEPDPTKIPTQIPGLDSKSKDFQTEAQGAFIAFQRGKEVKIPYEPISMDNRSLRGLFFAKKSICFYPGGIRTFVVFKDRQSNFGLLYPTRCEEETNYVFPNLTDNNVNDFNQPIRVIREEDPEGKQKYLWKKVDE